MSQAKLINGGLWVLNLLLGASIAVFAWQYLLATEAVDYFDGLTAPGDVQGPGTPPAPPPSDASLNDLPNPVKANLPGKPEHVAVVTSFPKSSLTGVFVSEKNPKKSVAFFKSSKASLVAFVGEPIEKAGKPAPGFTGWTLKEVTRNTAVFTNGREEETLKLGEGGPKKPGDTTASASSSPSAGSSYNASNFQSKLIASTDTRQIWGLDPAEIEWAKANKATLIDSSVRVSMHPQGGVKLESVMAGSMAGSRGLMAGDVVKNVNGISIKGLADMQKLQSHPSFRQSSNVRITIQRAGRPMLLEFRPLPRSGLKR